MKKRSVWSMRCALLALALLAVPATALANRVVFLDGVEHADFDAAGEGISAVESGRLDPAGPHVVEFAAGHRLHGTLEALDAERRELRWRRADSSAPFTFPLPEVSRLSFGAEAAREKPEVRRSGATVKLTGGDWFVAEDVVSGEHGELLLQLGGGEPFAVPREQVEWIYFAHKGAAPECYDGPTGLAGFTTSGGWTFRDGALRATSPTQLVRTFEALPDQVEYFLELSHAGAMNSLRILIGSRIRGANTQPIDFRLSGEQLQIWLPVAGNFKVQQVDVARLLRAPEPEPARGGLKLDRSRKLQLRLLHDFAGGRFAAFINGQRAGEWAVDKGAAGENRGNFSFHPTAWDANSEQTISRLRVGPWDGRIDAAEPAAERDTVALAGGEVKLGTLEALTGEHLALSTDGGSVSLPREKVKLLRLRASEADAADAGRTPSMARVRLAGSGEFDASGLAVREGGLVLRTRWSGALPLPLAAVREVAFEDARASAPGATDVLLFKNGDQLHGHLESAAPGEKVAWRAAAGDEPFTVQPAGVLGIRAAERAGGAAAHKTGVVARFKNGDVLEGDLLALDAAQLVLDTAEAGRLTLPRERVHTLYFSAEGGAPPVLDGSTGVEEWMKGVTLPRVIFANGGRVAGGSAPPQPNPWRAFDGDFFFSRAPAALSGGGVMSAPALGRIVEGMPQSVEFSFDVRVQKHPAVFSAQVFFEPEVPGCMLQVHSQGLYLHDMAPRRRAGGMPQQIQFDGKIKPEASHRRVRLLADRPAGKLIVVIDGVVIGQIARKPGESLRNLGRGFSLMPQAAAPCTFSNLWVGPWDGRVPGRSSAATEMEAAPHSLLLVNGDEARGTVESATPEVVKLQSEIGAIEVPTSRLTMMQLSGAPVEPRPAARLRLREGGALTLHSYRVEGGAVRGQSEVAGAVTVPLAAVGEIVFGPGGKEAGKVDR